MNERVDAVYVEKRPPIVVTWRHATYFLLSFGLMALVVATSSQVYIQSQTRESRILSSVSDLPDFERRAETWFELFWWSFVRHPTIGDAIGNTHLDDLQWWHTAASGAVAYVLFSLVMWTVVAGRDYIVSMRAAELIRTVRTLIS